MYRHFQRSPFHVSKKPNSVTFVSSTKQKFRTDRTESSDACMLPNNSLHNREMSRIYAFS